MKPHFQYGLIGGEQAEKTRHEPKSGCRQEKTVDAAEQNSHGSGGVGAVLFSGA